VTAGDPVPLGNPFASRRCLYYNRLPRRVQVPLLTNISTPGTDHAATAMSHFPAEQTGNPLAATPSARYEPSYAKRPMTLPTAGCSETVCPEGKHLLRSSQPQHEQSACMQAEISESCSRQFLLACSQNLSPVHRSVHLVTNLGDDGASPTVRLSEQATYLSTRYLTALSEHLTNPLLSASSHVVIRRNGNGASRNHNRQLFRFR